MNLLNVSLFFKTLNSTRKIKNLLKKACSVRGLIVVSGYPTKEIHLSERFTSDRQ